MGKWVLAVMLAGSLPAQAPDGKKIFESQCALCHGQSGGGGRGPSLRRPKLGHAPDDSALANVISEGIPPEMPASWQLTAREVGAVASYVRSLGAIPQEKLPGDASRGELVYQAKKCGACHIVDGKGEGFGPELSDIGARRNAAHLRQAVTRPASALPEDFLYVAATTSQGTVRGIRVNEDSFTIQIKDARGRFHSYAKSELKQLTRLAGETPMPSFEGALSAAELDDLVAYLDSLKGKS